LTSEVFLALLKGNERPELIKELAGCFNAKNVLTAYLVEVDDGLPVVVLELVEVSHTDLSEVTRMVFVQVGSVVVLTTGHTTTTGMLAVLSDTTMTGRDVTTAEDRVLVHEHSASGLRMESFSPSARAHRSNESRIVIEWRTYCLRVLVSLVGILTDVVAKNLVADQNHEFNRKIRPGVLRCG
jgi:hypothetical protein